MRLRRIMVVAVLVAVALPASASARPPACIARAADALASHPRELPERYAACRPALRRALERAGIRTGPPRLRAVFAMATVNAHVPYGPEPPTAGRFDELRRQPALTCAGYTLLTARVFTRVGGDPERLLYVGWDGGAVGNHAQMIVAGLLVDPTVGLVAATNLQRLTAGRPVNRTVDLGTHDVDSASGDVAEHVPGGFRDHVLAALRAGAFRPEDVLYTLTERQMQKRLATSRPENPTG